MHVYVRKCFDRARHELLMDLLSQHVAGEAFFNLIRMFLTNTIMGSDGTIYTNTEIGILQGSVLYPILMNIILRQLDLFAFYN